MIAEKLFTLATHPTTPVHEASNAALKFVKSLAKERETDSMFIFLKWKDREIADLKHTVENQQRKMDDLYRKLDTAERQREKLRMENARLGEVVSEVQGEREFVRGAYSRYVDAFHEIDRISKVVKGDIEDMVDGPPETIGEKILRRRGGVAPKPRADPSTSFDPEVALYGAVTGEFDTLTPILHRARANGFTGVKNTLRGRLNKLAKAGVLETHHFEWGDQKGTMWRLSAE